MVQETNRVAVVTVTYGNRWKYLSQVIETLIDDSHVVKIIVVDNASENSKEIVDCSARYPDKFFIIRNERNVGSAGGYFQGLKKAREIKAEHVLVLDDDNVLEKDGIDQFLKNLDTLPDKKVVLAGNRGDMEGNLDFFYVDPDDIHNAEKNKKASTTFFQVFKLSKIKNFLNIVTGNKKAKKKGAFSPIVPNESFAFGGSFIPMQAVIDAPLPDSKLFLYGDDIEYSWSIKKLGYDSYVCARPYIRDVDMTFQEGSHIVGLFLKSTQDYKVYFRLRNMMVISMRHNKGFFAKLSLIINMQVWTLGLYLIALSKCGHKDFVWKRYILVFRALWNGFWGDFSLPRDVKLPGNAVIL